MLVQFKMKNVLSFKEETIFDMLICDEGMQDS